MPRPKGSPNKLGTEARDNIAAVFTRLGGTHAMAKWAEQNQTEFYRLYAKLIPANAQITGEDGGPVTITIGWRSST